MALSLEVTTEPPPDISERSTISLRTRALARWGADAGYFQSAADARDPGRGGGPGGVRGAFLWVSIRFSAYRWLFGDFSVHDQGRMDNLLKVHSLPHPVDVESGDSQWPVDERVW